MTIATTNQSRDAFRMVALDLDGTLLTSKHQLADEQADYLRTLHKTGFRLCIATGRAAPSVYDIVKKLALPEPTPVVCSNGARGFLLSYDHACDADNENKDQKELFYTPVSREAVTKSLELAKELGYFVQYYLDDGIYANPVTDTHHQMVKDYERLTSSSVQVVTDFQKFIGSEDDSKLPSKLLIRCEKEEFADCHPSFVKLLYPTTVEGDYSKGMMDRLAHIVAAYNDDLDWFLEILNPDVNKGFGLRSMCQKLEVAMSNVIAIGDGTNDIEFLQISGLGIAMNNAHDSLKKVASYTMEWTNDEHGVMKTLEDLKMKGKLFCNEARA
mmetsp:Transcript_5846/g.16653  ORF Transcript_5846/g.16653 Transcript_5846/m.16653 type:complete len:328 (-) Transcript_5846:523-1506(-)